MLKSGFIGLVKVSELHRVTFFGNTERRCSCGFHVRYVIEGHEPKQIHYVYVG